MTPEEIFAALLGPAGMTDPYPLYEALHEHGDVVTGMPGIVLACGYETVSAVLRDPAYEVEDAQWYDKLRPGWREHPSLNTESILTQNDPAHARIRALMARQFTHRRVRALEPAIARLTGALLDTIAEHGAGGAAVDFMGEFACALPVAVICELIGVPDWDAAALRPLARSLTAVLEPVYDDQTLNRGDAAAIALTERFTELVALRIAEPRADLVSELAAVAAAGDQRLSASELVQNLILLLIAGFETTTNLLGNGLAIMLADPAAGDCLRSGTVDAALFTDEVLRYDSPVQDTGRRRRTPGLLGGLEVGPDEQVVLMLGAANRDPAKFAEPGAFRPERAEGAPLSFGAGPHFCLGSALARMEGTVALPMLLRRFPSIAAAGPAERRLGLAFRGYEHLPVSVS